MAHPLPTNLGSCEGLFYCLADWAYDVTGGLFWALIFLGFLIVLFVGTQRFGTSRAFGFSSTIGIFGSIFLATMQLIPWWVATLFILGGLVGFAILRLNER